MTEYDITVAFQAIENELIASMVRNMDHHRAEETKEGIQWSMWQAEQLKALEKYKALNQEKYQKQFRNINSDISTLIQQARAAGNMQQEIAILNAIKNGFKAKKVSPGMTGEFFRLNDRKLEALIQATTHDMEKAETAILRMANDQYRKAIFNAQVYANSGAGTYEQAVDMATKNMLAAGLNCVEYKNGARHTLSDYADMAIRTASKRAYLAGEGEKRQEWGISTVIVNKRGNPCPKCLPFCGKVLIDDVWSGGKRSDGPYPLMSTAIAAGLYHPRCKDSHTTYFPGISTADNTWTPEELEAIGKANKQEADQQYEERQAARFGRLAEYSLDDENQKRYAARREEWKKRQAVKNNANNIDKQERFKQRREAALTGTVPDFSIMSTSQINEWVKANLKTSFIGTKGANSEFVADAAKVMAEFERKMGGTTIEGLKVQFGGTPKGVYAKYDDKTNTLLLKKTGSKAAFEKAHADENARFKRKWKSDKDYYATETYTGTIWHELGHAVDFDRGQDLSRALSRNPGLDVSSVKISGYAGTTGYVRVTKRSEAWAENFAAYMEGGKKAQVVPEEIKGMVDGYFEKSFKKSSENDIMKAIKIPDTVCTARNITPGIIDDIQNGINEILNEYDAKIDACLVEDVSARNPGVPYFVRFSERDGLKRTEFIINSGFDFENFETVVKNGYECGYFAGKNIKDHAIHEMAHVMTGQQYRTMLTFNDFAEKLQREFVPGISGYSDDVKDGFETIAEAFVRMRNGEYIPDDARILVEKYIERWRKD